MPPAPPLHVVTDDVILARPGFSAAARLVLEAGGRDVALHLRGPRTAAARLHALAVELLAPARRAGALLLVNDRVDLVLAAGLDGVQLGDRSLPVAEARTLLPDRRVGRSAHDAAAAREATAGGADWLVVGTVFATASHPDCSPSGPGRLRAIGEVTELPMLAIGGVTPVRVPDVLAAGARGVAVLSGVWGAPEPAGAVQGYLKALESGGLRARADRPT